METVTFRQVSRVLVSAVFTAALLGIPSLLPAQMQLTYKVGDRVEADPMLLGKWRPATVIEIHLAGGEVNGYEIRFDAENNRKPEEYTVGNSVARGIRPAQGGANAGRQAGREPGGNPAANGRPLSTVPPTPAPAQERAVAGGACPSDAVLTAAPKATDSMELSFMRAILGNYRRKLTETSATTPLAVGVNFATFQTGAPRVNQRTLDRVDGSYIRSAPVGANIYPVKTTFTECELYRGEIDRTSIDGRYECFKDNFGEWACGNASGWRRLDTKREMLGAQ